MISCLQRIQKKGHLKLLPRPPSQGNCSVFLISQETPTCRKMLKGQGQAPVFSNCVRSIDGRLILSHKPLISFRSPTVNWGVSSSHRLRPEASNHSSSNSGCWGPLCSKQGFPTQGCVPHRTSMEGSDLALQQGRGWIWSLLSVQGIRKAEHSGLGGGLCCWHKFPRFRTQLLRTRDVTTCSTGVSS